MAGRAGHLRHRRQPRWASTTRGRQRGATTRRGAAVARRPDAATHGARPRAVTTAEVPKITVAAPTAAEAGARPTGGGARHEGPRPDGPCHHGVHRPGDHRPGGPRPGGPRRASAMRGQGAAPAHWASSTTMVTTGTEMAAHHLVRRRLGVRMAEGQRSCGPRTISAGPSGCPSSRLRRISRGPARWTGASRTS